MSNSIADIARLLTSWQRDFLVDHVDGVRPLTRNHIEEGTRTALMERKLVRYQPPIHVTARPSGTVLTDLGREVLCCFLGYYADALYRARVIEYKPIIKVRAYGEMERTREPA